MIQVGNKKCLVILGMHRSGTSALSGALMLAGFNPGKQLFDPEEDNPKGNFENARITMLNQRILHELYARWNDTLLIPEDWWKFDVFNEYLKEIQNILTDEYAHRSPVLLKDPRLSVLLPLYLVAFKNLHIDASFIICVRNPMEIVESLMKRNHLSKEKIMLLYMDYLLKAELFTRGFPRILLSYENFLKDPLKCLKSLKGTLAPEILLNPEIESKIAGFLDAGLKHHRISGQIPQIKSTPDLSRLFNLLNSNDLRDLTQLDQLNIDEIRANFYEYFHFYNGLPGFYEAKITAMLDDGSKISFKTTVKYGHNLLKFDISPAISIRKIYLQPSNSRVGIKINDVEFYNEKDNRIEWNHLESNASYENDEGTLIFDIEMPEIIYAFKNAVTISLVIVNMDYLAFGRTTYRMGLNFSSESYDELESKLKSVEDEKYLIDNKFSLLERHLQNKDKELTRIRQAIADNNRKINTLQRMNNRLNHQVTVLKKSLTWKTGRFITYPFRQAYNLFTRNSR